MFGVDTVRLFLLFKAPMEGQLDWDQEAILGQQRWIQRLWALVQNYNHVATNNNITPTNLTTNLEDQEIDLGRAVNDTIVTVTQQLGKGKCVYQYS